jgi:hypothetical protein
MGGWQSARKAGGVALLAGFAVEVTLDGVSLFNRLVADFASGQRRKETGLTAVNLSVRHTVFASDNLAANAADGAQLVDAGGGAAGFFFINPIFSRKPLSAHSATGCLPPRHHAKATNRRDKVPSG